MRKNKKEEEENKVKEMGKTLYCPTNEDHLTLEVNGLWKGLWSNDANIKNKSVL